MVLINYDEEVTLYHQNFPSFHQYMMFMDKNHGMEFDFRFQHVTTITNTLTNMTLDEPRSGLSDTTQWCGKCDSKYILFRVQYVMPAIDVLIFMSAYQSFGEFVVVNLNKLLNK